MLKKIQTILKTVFTQEFAKAGLCYAIANIAGQGVILLSSAAFTRMMSKTDYGLVSTYSTWVLVLNTFIGCNLFITVRNAAIDVQEDFDRYNASVLLLSFISGLAVTVLILAGTAAAAGRPDLPAALACVQALALNMINFKLTVQSVKNEYRQRVFLMIAPNWLHTLLSAGLLLTGRWDPYLAKIFGNAAGLLLPGVLCMWTVFQNTRPQIVPAYWKYALKISLPSVLHTLSDLILMQCDRLMLTYLAGAAQSAEYSVIYNAGSILTAIYQAVNGAWIPWFYAKAAQRDTQTVRTCQKYYVTLFTVLACGLMTISPELIRLISPESYWDGIRYTGPIVTASYLMFLYAFYSGYLMYQKKSGSIARNTMTAAVLNLILNGILIPEYGAEGAVAATVGAYLMLYVLQELSIGREGRSFFSRKVMYTGAACVAAYGWMADQTRECWMARYGMFALFFLIVIQGMIRKDGM